MEAEIKLRLPSGAAFAALCTRHAPGKRGVLQRNEFFDTSDEAFASANYHLRLRSERDHDKPSGKEKFIVTVKGPKVAPVSGSSIAIRPEEEVVVDAATAHSIRRGDSSPLDVLPPSRLTAEMHVLANGQKAAYNGACFENTRVCATVTLPASGALVITREVTLEIDASRFEWAGEREEQWEVECEIPAADAAALAGPIEGALQTLLRGVCGGASCPPAKGKLTRLKHFRKAVEARRGAQRAEGASDAEANRSSSATGSAKASDDEGAGSHMLAFAQQSAFEHWLRQCPLSPSELTEYAVMRTQSGFDVRCHWHLPFTKPGNHTTAAPATAAAPSSPPAQSPPAAPLPSMPQPQSASRAAASAPAEAETMASLQALLQAAQAQPQSASRAAASAPAEVETMAKLQALLQAAQAPAVAAPAEPAVTAVPDDASTLAFVKRSLAHMTLSSATAVGVPSGGAHEQTSAAEHATPPVLSTTSGSGVSALVAARAQWDNGSARPDPPSTLEESGVKAKASPAAPGSGGVLFVRGEQPPTEQQPVGYLWAQSLGEVGVSLCLPAGTRAKALSVRFKSTQLLIAMAHPKRALLDVGLLCPVVPEECTWTIESRREGSAEVLTLQVTLEKAARGTFWRCLAEGHECVEMPQRWPLVGV